MADLLRSKHSSSIGSRRELSVRADYDPALCVRTVRRSHRLVPERCCGKFNTPYHLEGGEVVTRFP